MSSGCRGEGDACQPCACAAKPAGTSPPGSATLHAVCRRRNVPLALHALQIPAFAGYQLMVHVVLPWWNTPKLDDMPETGGLVG